MKEKNNNGKEILKLLQEKFEVNSARELFGALKKMFKDILQEETEKESLSLKACLKSSDQE